jgi:hypothetical protein
MTHHDQGFLPNILNESDEKVSDRIGWTPSEDEAITSSMFPPSCFFPTSHNLI